MFNPRATFASGRLERVSNRQCQQFAQFVDVDQHKISADQVIVIRECLEGRSCSVFIFDVH